jgi:hypothetical protein
LGGHERLAFFGSLGEVARIILLKAAPRQIADESVALPLQNLDILGCA